MNRAGATIDLISFLTNVAIKRAGPSAAAIVQIYHDITGNVDSPRGGDVSISAAFREAVFHIVVEAWDPATASALDAFGKAAYFSESSFQLANWQTRYWGEHYPDLLAAKREWDQGKYMTTTLSSFCYLSPHCLPRRGQVPLPSLRGE